jgi:hypothetical protein
MATIIDPGAAGGGAGGEYRLIGSINAASAGTYSLGNVAGKSHVYVEFYGNLTASNGEIRFAIGGFEIIVLSTSVVGSTNTRSYDDLYKLDSGSYLRRPFGVAWAQSAGSVNSAEYSLGSGDAVLTITRTATGSNPSITAEIKIYAK